LEEQRNSLPFSTWAVSDVTIPPYSVLPMENLTDSFRSTAMFDLVDNEVSFQLIREFHEAGRVVSAVCHGSAALVNATLADGTKLIAGEAVTGFSNEEEVIAKRPQDMPFSLEEALDKASGGKYEKAKEPWAPHVVTSGLKTKKLLTGQNPASARPFAEELLKFIESS